MKIYMITIACSDRYYGDNPTDMVYASKEEAEKKLDSLNGRNDVEHYPYDYFYHLSEYEVIGA